VRILFFVFSNFFGILFMSHDIYLDANATSPCCLPPQAPPSRRWGLLRQPEQQPCDRPARQSRPRRDARARAARARRGPGRVLFTSGATEGIQTAVLSALCAVRERRAAGEMRRPADLRRHRAQGGVGKPGALEPPARHRLTLCALPVDGAGRHRLDLLRELAPRAAMVCTMAANNETGVISDLDGIAGVLRERAPRAYWMVDCVQALGKLPLDLANSRIDYAPFSGHKLYAPKGIGMLYVRDGAPYTPLMIGGGQEAGQRSGTENMAGIAALGAVLAALEEGGVLPQPRRAGRDARAPGGALREAFPGIVFNAPFELALPTTLNFAVPDMASKELLDLFDAAGVRVSAGSACSAAKAAPSYVLEAMGLPAWRTSGAVRLSFGPLASERSSMKPARASAAAARRRGGRRWRLRRTSAATARPAAGELRGPPRLDPVRPRSQRLRGDRSAGRHGGADRGPGPRPAACARWPCWVPARCGRAPTPAPCCARPSAWTPARRARSAGRATALSSRWPTAARRRRSRSAARCWCAGGRASMGAAPSTCWAARLTAGSAPQRCAWPSSAGRDGGRRRTGVARLIDGGTVLCHGADIGGAPCATAEGLCKAAQRRRRRCSRCAGPPGRLPARARGRAAGGRARSLRAGCGRHEPARPRGAGGAAVAPGRASRPLLAAPHRPLVFVCRSGNRSARAALCLQRLGHRAGLEPGRRAGAGRRAGSLQPYKPPVVVRRALRRRVLWRTRDKRPPAVAASRYTSVHPGMPHGNLIP
jgi:cysteine desulfurase